jgi:hypothetical protein
MAADGRTPPWCPHCGVDIKRDALVAPAAAVVAAAPVPKPVAAITLPEAPTPRGAAGLLETVEQAPTESFFHACDPALSDKCHRIFRFYITPSDLLVFALGMGAVSEGQVLPRTKSILPPTMGGMAGAMARMEESKDLQLAKRIEELDAANEKALRDMAESGDRGYVVGPDDVKWMTLAGPSLWNSWVCSVQHEAMLKFKHRKQGSLAFALPSLRDARRAAEHLPRLFGERVQVSLSWGSGK